MRLVAASSACVSLAFAMLVADQPLKAQTIPDPFGLTAGTILLRGRLVGILPDNSNSTITPIGGHIQVSNSVSPEFDLSYFFTDHLAIEGEAGITHNQLTAEDTAFGNIAVGKIWGAPVVLLAQYHFLPDSRINPYAGVGLSIQPYFAPQPAGGTVQQLSVKSQVGAAFQIGLDYQITGRWYGNLDVKKILVNSYATVNDGAITAAGQLNPLIIGLGIGYRF
jgi:outer membrane protein